MYKNKKLLQPLILMKFSIATLISNIVTISLPTLMKNFEKAQNIVRWPTTSAQMFSRNFRFVRSGLPSKCFSLEINQVEFLGLNATTYVVGLRTSTRHMPKKPRVARGTQQSHEPDPVKQGEGTNAAISLNKDGQICVRIVAKPGAKQSNITGETWTRKTKRSTCFSFLFSYTWIFLFLCRAILSSGVPNLGSKQY